MKLKFARFVLCAAFLFNLLYWALPAQAIGDRETLLEGARAVFAIKADDEMPEATQRRRTNPYELIETARNRPFGYRTRDQRERPLAQIKQLVGKRLPERSRQLNTDLQRRFHATVRMPLAQFHRHIRQVAIGIKANAKATLSTWLKQISTTANQTAEQLQQY
ncbi:MAG: hypothetical protein WBD47_07545 [Phormidesmis sp.]